jgi:hypothetical protein
MRSRDDGARYRRRMLVVMIVATGMVCVKLVAMSWKSTPAGGTANRIGQLKDAPSKQRAH